MIKNSLYHSSWQQNRIDFIISKYSKDFFAGKKILELGAYNGYIGAYFNTLGAEVHCLEGRVENVVNILNDYPNITASCENLDTPNWNWGKYDIIINFGLYYHLEKYHKEHLNNCIDNCDLMFFETVVYDSYESELYFRAESGDDQSLSSVGGNPSTSYVENIFKEKNVQYKKYTDPFLNNHEHKYDWPDSGGKIFNQFHRRFWIVKK
jgi:hypothetical protein